MAVHNLAARDEWTRKTFGGRPQSCFLCGEEASPVVVGWHGCPRENNGEPLIILHPACATKFATRLITDAMIVQRLLNGKRPLAGIDKTLFPQGEA